MNWWISIVFYLWQNSLRRWIEQPLSLLSKLLIASMVGCLGALVIAGASYLGNELDRQLANRDALTVNISEVVDPFQASAMISPESTEETAWAATSSECLVSYQSPKAATIDGKITLELIGLRNVEAHGYPDTLVLVSATRPVGSSVVVTIDDFRAEALVLPPTEELKRLQYSKDFLIAPLKRITPLLQKGFVQQIQLQVASLNEMRRVHKITETLQILEDRRMNIRSALKILEKIEAIRKIQGYVLIAAAIGSALVLGLTCGALAWMEFREDRYLLSLIRSFGIGRLPLLIHSVMENCAIAVAGVCLGLGLIQLAASTLNLNLLGMQWLSSLKLIEQLEIRWLILGAFCGGLLSCIPIGIGLRKPLGLVLK